ncbi:ATP-binding protein [Microbacterium foliorum]|uniref:Divergent AAA domain protein n=1 Tax=Microbacterium foliorum TaxID=104336 RepID=A0A0F0KLL7_9MICO|nr:ATP-binding protein [Microbacterium foliorum]AXL10741.1 ATP-binding protein [Microbacterium foliorum]KJL21777.1 Divergent AAA domain protein [Microbacterium foliorum]
MWTPRTEHDIQLAIDEGNLAENYSLDVKQWSDVTANEKGRRETARDLASFSIGGGALLFGVAEDTKERTFTRVPFALAGEAERIEQIAATRIDPPLPIRVTDIPSDADPSTGYLLVEIPPSPHAPHMSDGRYYARGDRTKRQLTDAEVVRLHQDRRKERELVEEALTAWVSRNMSLDGGQKHAHLHLAAVPLSNYREDALEHIARAHDQQQAVTLFVEVEAGLARSLLPFQPTLQDGHRWVAREAGAAWTTLDEEGKLAESWFDERSLLDAEIHDDGSFRVLMGGLSDYVASEGTQRAVFFEVGLISWVWRAVLLAQAVSEEMDYRGPWGVGLYVDGLKGQVSWAVEERKGRFLRQRYVYPLDTYEAVTTTHLVELEGHGDDVVNRLVRKLIQGFRSYDEVTDLIRGGRRT